MASGIITMVLCGTAEAQPQKRFLGRFCARVGAMVAEGSSPRCGDRDTFTETGSWRRSRSEPISLTGTESGGVSIDRDGEAALEPKLRGLG